MQKNNINLGACDSHWFDAGGDGDVLHFYHANAYPFGTYRQLLQHLTDQHKVIGLSHRATWRTTAEPSKRITWKTYAKDLIHFLDTQQHTTPVIGAGHSMGAVTTLIAAVLQPELFRALVLVDPVFLPKSTLTMLSLSPRPLKQRLPVIAKALNRPNQWQTAEECIHFHKRKSAFARFSPEAMTDFSTYGLNQRDNHYHLAFPREWEAHIYSTIPNVWNQLEELKVPVLVIRGEHSDVLSQSSWAKMQRLLPHGDFTEVTEAGHLVPLEAPEKTALIIKDWISSLPDTERNEVSA